MPLQSCSHTGLAILTDGDSADDLPPLEKLSLMVSQLTKEALLEGRGQMYEIEDGTVSIAHLADVELPGDLADGEESAKDLIVLCTPPDLGQLLVAQLSPEQAASIDYETVLYMPGEQLLTLAFEIAVDGELSELLKRLFAVSKINEEVSAIIKPLVLNHIQDGTVTIAQLLSSRK